MRDYVPRNDEALRDCMSNFLPVLPPHLAEFGMVAADLQTLQDLSNGFSDDLTAYVQLAQETLAMSAQKKNSRKAMVAELRPIVQRINHHPAMTDAMRVSLGLKPSNVSTNSFPIEELIPDIFLETTRGKVTVHWGPNPMNEGRNGKPEGVKGANIYRKAAGEDKFQLIAFSSSSPYYDYVTGPARDYTYIVRYRGTKETDLSNESTEETVAARGALAA